MNILLIGLGGFIGTILRYSISTLVQNKFKTSYFPYGTLTVNIIGCFILGGVMALIENKGFLSKDIRLFLTIGVLGGFTTFSTFMYESFALMHDGEFIRMISNISIQTCLGLIAVYIGYTISTLI